MGWGGEIEVAILPGAVVNYGDKVKFIGSVEDRLIGDKRVGFRLLNSDVHIDLASKLQRVVQKW